jgi:acyl dehydratase
MAIDYHKALALDIPAVEQTFTERDTMLYALGLGLGSDPMEEAELRYVYEKGLRTFPTMPVVQAFVSLRAIDLGIDYTKMVHGEQSLRLHAPLPVAGTLVGKTRVTQIVDRGVGKGALVYLDRELRDKATGTLLATAGMSAFCRADGGFGGPVTEGPAPHTLPDRAADLRVDIPTLPQAALIYRLSGDLNPLHSDPEVARRAGFDRPILHGLATFGIVARAVVSALLEHDGSRLESLTGRFSAPVFPGETIRVELWRDGEAVGARASSVQRGTVVFNNGRATLRA